MPPPQYEYMEVDVPLSMVGSEVDPSGLVMPIESGGSMYTVTVLVTKAPSVLITFVQTVKVVELTLAGG